MRTGTFNIALGAIALALAGAASAAPVPVTSYTTPNGGGQASGGGLNYWDGSYDGSGSTTTDGAILSGGTSDLTDGFASGQPWYQVENAAGTGPYVGWYQPAQPNPLLTFFFGGSPTIDSIAIALDNSGVGGVFGPASIEVDGVARAFVPPALGSAGTVTLSGLGLTGASHTIRFVQQPGLWVFVSEIGFDGSAGSAVPEPASWATMIAGLGMIGAVRRRMVGRNGVQAAPARIKSGLTPIG